MPMTDSDIIYLIDHLGFFEHLTPSEQEFILSHAAIRKFARQEVIHAADALCIGLLLVMEGSIRISMLSDDGREITLYRLHPGEVCILSASCVLSCITFDVSIDAVTEVKALQISSMAIAKAMTSNIYVKAYAYELAAERFSDVMWAMQQILFLSFDRRLSIFLLDESTRLHSSELKMTHEEIARLMGSAREVVTRMLKYFSTEGYVALSRGSIRILDNKELQKLAD